MKLSRLVVRMLRKITMRLEEALEPAPLRELGLPKVYRMRLGRGGIQTVEDLCQKTERDLYRIRLVGQKCIEAVGEALAKRGLALKELE